MLSLPAVANAATITLAWDANPDSALAGYVVAYGTSPGAYTTSVDVGNTVSYSIAGLTSGTRYYFAVRSYNSAGVSGLPSNEVNEVAPASAPDITPPTATMTGPSGGAQVGGSVALSASAADNVAVAGVRFHVDGVAVGVEDTAAPYTFTWNTVGVSNGSHALTAVARDAAGNLGTSPVVTVQVMNDTTLPTATVTSPAAGAQVSASVVVSATATDNVAVAGVRFHVDGVAVGVEDTTVPYSHTWNTVGASNGLHALTAVARDTAGNLRTSAVVTVQVLNAAPPPGTGLVAAYGFDEGTGTATADASGQGNPGTLAGAVWKPGRFGQSLEFDGTTAWVTVAANNAVNFPATMTVEAWIYPTEAGGFRSVVFKEAPGEIWDHNYGLYSTFGAEGPGGHVLLDGFADNTTAHAPALIVLNRWTHVATTYDGSVLRAYVDGVERAAVAAAGPINVSAGVLRMGGNSIYGDFFKGQIDEVRLYSRALSPAEIATDMSTPIGTPPAGDTTPPTTAITAPAAGSQVSGSVAVSATATDNVAVAGVTFQVDGVAAGAEDTTAPYAYTWNTVSASNGPHTLTAVARDTAGNLQTSAVVTVQVMNTDTTLPAVTVTAPAAGSQVSGLVAVSATATDNVAVAGVTFQVDGVAAGAEDTTAPYAYTWNTVSASNGSHALTAVARDTAGNLRTSAVVTVQVMNTDTTLPAVTVTAPAAGSQVSGSVAVSATATDNVAVAGVTFQVDGVAAGAEDTTAPYAYTWNTVSASNGSHALTAVARDTAGNLRTSAVVTVQVMNTDTTLPAVTVTAPAAGSQVSGSVAVSATATDNVAVAGVTFQVDGVAAGAEDTTAPYAYTWNTVSASNGPHALTAVARDTAGNLQTSAVVTVQVSNTTPPPPVGSGLVAAYGFDEGAGTSAADASGQGNTATVAGATWTPGRFGQSLTFDGVADWVTVAASAELNFTAAMTIEAWVYPTEADGWRLVVFKEAPGEIHNHNYGLYSAFGLEGSGGHVLLDGFADNVRAHAPAAIVLNRWTHLATTYDGSVLRAYVDGVERMAVAATGAINTSGGVLRLGGNSMYGDFFKGRIDEVRLYDRALSAAEISADMATPIDSGLVAAYGFDENAGTTAADASGRGNAGIITGATWKAGKFGRSLGFDGQSNWVTVGASAAVNVTTTMTIEAWVYPTEAAGWRTVVFKEAPAELNAHTYALYSTFGVEGPGGHVVVSSQRNAHDPAEILLNRWTHLATTYDGSMLRTYVDGVLRASTVATGPISVSNGSLRIGGNAMWGDYFKGRIDEVRLYNRALSAAEILADMITPVTAGGQP